MEKARSENGALLNANIATHSRGEAISKGKIAGTASEVGLEPA